MVEIQREPLIDIKTAAAFLGLKENSLRIMCMQKRVPFLRAGRRLRFKLSTLESWASSRGNGDVSATRIE